MIHRVDFPPPVSDIQRYPIPILINYRRSDQPNKTSSSSSSSSFLSSRFHLLDYLPSEQFLRRSSSHGTDLHFSTFNKKKRFFSFLRFDLFLFVLIDLTDLRTFLLQRAQRKEHGRSLRGRRLIVEFTKTTPGQNGRRGRYFGGDDRVCSLINEKCLSLEEENRLEWIWTRSIKIP